MTSLRILWEPLKGFWSRAGSPIRSASTRQKEAQRYLAAGDYVSAESALVGALEEAQRLKFPPNRILRVTLQLAEVQKRQAALPAADPEGEWIGAAEQSARQAVEQAVQANDSEGYVEALTLYAQILGEQNRWDAAEGALLEALRRGGTATIGPAAIQRRHLLGVALHKQHRHAEAAEALEQALEIQKSSVGRESVETANLVAATGKIFRAQGDQDRAQDYLRAALRVHRDLLGETSREVFEDLLNLGGSLEDAGDLEGAAGQFEMALQIRHRQLGVSHLEPLAEMQFSLANLYAGWDNYSRARELLAECIGTFRRTGGARLAVCYETLAQVEEASGHHSTALRELENASKAWEKCGRDRIVELTNNLEYRADLLDDMRKPGQAAWLRERAAKLRADAGLAVPDKTAPEKSASQAAARGLT